MRETINALLLCGLVVASLLAAGCSLSNDAIHKEADLSPPTFRQSEFIFHRVMAGENMASIARWYSGKESHWRRLAEHNPSLDPWRLKKNDIVRVPVSMASVHSEQPKASTAPRTRSRKTRPPSHPGRLPQDVEEEDSEEGIFGPR